MSKDYDLFGKTFDQQVETAGADIIKADIFPNTRISAEVIFEPLDGGVRVTARDGRHQMLWGFIASHGMLSRTHSPVAIYEELQSLLREELKKQGQPTVPSEDDPIENATRALAALDKTVAALKESIDVKKITPATRLRAKGIARVARDANRQIALETNLGRIENDGSN